MTMNPGSKRELFLRAWEESLLLRMRKCLREYVVFHEQGMKTKKVTKVTKVTKVKAVGPLQTRAKLDAPERQELKAADRAARVGYLADKQQRAADRKSRVVGHWVPLPAEGLPKGSKLVVVAMTIDDAMACHLGLRTITDRLPPGHLLKKLEPLLRGALRGWLVQTER